MSQKERVVAWAGGVAVALLLVDLLAVTLLPWLHALDAPDEASA